MAMFDQLMEAIGVSQRNLADETSVFLQNTKKQESLQDQVTATLEQAARDEAIVAQQKGLAELQAQQSRLKIAFIFGTNVEDQNNALKKLADERNKAYEARQAALKTIEEKQSTSFFQNPLGYIFNQLTINEDIAKHNAADARVENADKSIQQLNAMTDSSFKVNNQLAEGYTQARVEAETRKAAANLQILAYKSAIDGIGYNTAGVQAVQSARKEALANSISLYSAYNAQEHLKISQENLDLARQRFNQDKVEFNYRKEKYETEQQLDSSMLQYVNAGITLTGGTPLNGMNGKQVVAMMKGNSPLARQYYDYYMIGKQSAEKGSPVIASSIGNAAQVFSDVPVKLTKAQEPIKEIVQQATRLFMENNKKPGTPEAAIDLKDKNAVSAAISRIGNQLVLQQASNVKFDDPANIFNVGTVNTIAENSVAVRELPVYKKVLEPLVKAGDQLSDPARVAGLVADAVANKQITYNEALDITTIYHAGVSLNVASRQHMAFGIVPPMTYKAKDMNRGITDFTKPDAVARMLNTYLSRKVSGQEAYSQDLLFGMH